MRVLHEDSETIIVLTGTAEHADDPGFEGFIFTRLREQQIYKWQAFPLSGMYAVHLYKRLRYVGTIHSSNMDLAMAVSEAVSKIG